MRVRVGEYELEMTNGDVRWRGHLTIGYFGAGKPRRHYTIVGVPSSVAEIRQSDDLKGWDVVLYGSVVAVERYKLDAQLELENAFSEELEAAEYATGWRTA